MMSFLTCFLSSSKGWCGFGLRVRRVEGSVDAHGAAVGLLVGDRPVASERGDEDGQEDHDGDVTGGKDRDQRDKPEDDQGRQPEGDERRLDLAEGGDELDGDTAEDG